MGSSEKNIFLVAERHSEHKEILFEGIHGWQSSVRRYLTRIDNFNLKKVNIFI